MLMEKKKLNVIYYTMPQLKKLTHSTNDVNESNKSNETSNTDNFNFQMFCEIYECNKMDASISIKNIIM